MQYRNMGSLDLKVSVLGFGAMRLPVIDNNSANIDKEKALKMIRYSIDKGVNYIDTAWPYHQGESERFLAEVLKDGYREKIYLASKLPIWEIEKREELDQYLNKQLEKLEVETIDFYLLHALNKKRWAKVKRLKILAWLEEKAEQGKIKYIGFSFHDSYNVFSEILNSYQWDFCQIQYNYLDTEYQAGQKGLKKAFDKDIAVIVMEPLRGGWLAQEPPQNVKEIFAKTNKDWNAVEWALHWLWSQKEVSLVLSGMSNLEQVKENIKIAEESEPGLLSKNDYKMMEKAAEKMRGPISCTRCEYCLPCPVEVNIPEIFHLYNKAKLMGEEEKMADKYYELDEKTRADNCIECQQCEAVCPQNIEIIELLKQAEDFFSEYR